MESTYYSLASKNNFNKALRHFFTVNDVVGEIESRNNLADVINEELDAGEIAVDQILPIVGAVIRDKFNYSFDSFSIPVVVTDFQKIVDETVKWTALDIVLVYYNPSGEIMLINPNNIDHWARTRELAVDQLLVIYVKYLKEDNIKLEKEAIHAVEEMLSGRDSFRNKQFIDSTIVPKTPVQRQEPSEAAKGKKNMTPKYAVRVSNELFHNGNVEAWKKIIESYKVKFPDLEVYIYHENELINDINALFKWGKVKHGDSILFQVGGEEIRGVSKLQKYLFEGASHRYEQFLKINVGKVLNLF